MSAIPNKAPAGPNATLQKAMQLHQGGRLEEAEALYRRLLKVNPRHADALHLMGLAQAQRRRFDEAGRLIARAIAVLPNEAMFHNNLGNVHVERGQAGEALACYRRAHELQPDRSDVCNNLGVVLSRHGDRDEAERHLLRALELDPGYTDARNNLANHYLRNDRIQDALQVCHDALMVAPRNPTLRRVLGMIYASQGMNEEAANLYRAWLAEEPDNPEAKFRLTACTQQGVPERAPDDYVAQLFDQFANSFDAKLASLSYRAPELALEAVTRFAPPPAGQLDIIDAGCGTGLCGPLLKGWARRLVGVDLSPGMLEKARQRGVYDELVAAELVGFLRSRPASCELLVSTDTLIYFGPMQAVFAAAAGALRPGGVLVFTLEQHGAEDGAPDYKLCAHGRYSHRQGYVEGTLRTAGLTLLEMKSVVLRMEASQPVAGWLVSARAGMPH